MCRRHIILITHMKKQPVAVLIAKRRIPERSVGYNNNPTEKLASRRDAISVTPHASVGWGSGV